MRYAEHENGRDASQVIRRLRNIRNPVADRDYQVRVTVSLFSIGHVCVEKESADRTIGQLQAGEDAPEVNIPHVAFCLAGRSIGDQVGKELRGSQGGENRSVGPKKRNRRLDLLSIETVGSGIDVEIFNRDRYTRSLYQLIVIDHQSSRKSILGRILIQAQTEIFQVAAALIPGNAD